MLPRQDLNNQTTAANLDSLPAGEAAKIAVEEVGPRVYELTGFTHDDLVVYLTGCCGTGQEDQFRVAELEDKIAKESGRRPDFIIIVGDFLYPAGANSPFDPALEKSFYKPYYSENLRSEINAVPTIVAFGNHEYRKYFEAHNTPFLTKGKQLGINAAAASYIPDDHRKKPPGARVFHKISEVRDHSSQPKVDLGDMQALNMQYYYQSYIAGGTQFFILDSNYFAKEFIEYIACQNDPVKLAALKNNQVKWFLDVYRDADEHQRKKIFCMHHLFYTQSKRAVPSGYDRKYFLEDDELRQLQQILNTNSESYNELLAMIFAYLKSMPDVLVGAHDHNLSMYNTRNVPANKLNYDPARVQVFQIGAGGGGGELQKRKIFVGQAHTGIYLSETGFWILTCNLNNPDIFKFDGYTTSDHHLEFTDQSELPQRLADKEENKNKVDKLAEFIRLCIIAACNTFFEAATLNPPKQSTLRLFGNKVSDLKYAIQKVYHYDDIDRVHALLAYVNQPELLEFPKLISTLNQAFISIENKDYPRSILKNFQQIFTAAYPDKTKKAQMQAILRDIFYNVDVKNVEFRSKTLKP